MRPQAFLCLLLALLILAGMGAACVPARPVKQARPPSTATVQPVTQTLLPSAAPAQPTTQTPLPSAAPTIQLQPTQGIFMTPTLPKSRYQIMAYFPEWSAGQSYYVKDIERVGSAGKVTLINYAFGIPGPDPHTHQVVCQIADPLAAYGQTYTAEMSLDSQADDPTQPLRGHFNQLRKLKEKYPQTKVVVSLGGWTGSGWFSDAARTPEARQAFVKSCIDLFIQGNLPEINGAGGPGAGAGVFDGIDIDWEYPIKDGLTENHYDPEDGANFVLLLQEFRRQYAAIGRPDLLLTMAGPGPDQAAQYHLEEAHPYLDIISIMTYDLRGVGSSVSAHHTNLCTSSQDPVPAAKRLSADAAVQMYLGFGIPAEKLMIGAAFYGKAWQGVAAENHGLYQPGKFIGAQGGQYHELIQRIDHGYTRFWDESAKAPWLYSPDERIFWTYDDPQSVALKAEYVRRNGLGGVMFWEITGDDANGTLVDAIYRELQRSTPPQDPCSTP